jgi:polyferredoxin
VNPFGFFHAIFGGGIEIVTQLLGRKRRPETRRKRIYFALFYVLLLLLGTGTIIFCVWQLYSE